MAKSHGANPSAATRPFAQAGEQDILHRIRSLIPDDRVAHSTSAQPVTSVQVATSCATIEFTHVSVSFSTASPLGMGSDGASSMTDINEAVNESKTTRHTKPQAIPAFRGLETRGHSITHRQPWSKGQLRCGQRHATSRLPWLDGSPSRRGSVPSVPGAFEEDGTSTTYHSPLKSPMQSPAPQNYLPSKIPVSAGSAARKGSHSSSTPTISSSSALEITPPDTSPHDQLTEQQSRPAVPLISLARELYATDSTGMDDTETERSMKAARRRALGFEPYDKKPPLGLPPRSMQSSPQARRTTSHVAENDSPSPLEPASRRPTATGSSLNRESLLDSALKRPSMSLQPIRAKRVTITKDDVSTFDRAKRGKSFSVQPIRRQTRSLDEDLSSDIIKKPALSKSTTSRSPVEDNLRKSIADLETLMHSAVLLAKEAADGGRTEEVPAIMDEARLALHRASIVRENHAMAMDPNTESPGSTPSYGSTSSSEDYPRPRPTQPATRGHRNRLFADGPMSEHGSAKQGASPIGGGRAIWDEDWPHHRLEHPSKPEDPKTLDFAFALPAPSISAHPAMAAMAKSGEVLPIDNPLLNQQRPPLHRAASSKLPVCLAQGRNQDDVMLKSEPAYFRPGGSDARGAMGIGGFEGSASPQEQPPVSPVEPLPDASPGAGVSTGDKRGSQNWGRDKFDEREYARTDMLRGKHHLTLKEGQHFSINHGHRRQPIARNWEPKRKRKVAAVACANTALIGLLIGIYAGEVPAIQYTLADLKHQVILGNVYLYLGMALTTFLFWPLPLLHGRKPYTLVSLGLALPLQIPQAVIVQERRNVSGGYVGYITGLLLARGLLGLALGFAHINFKSTLLDLYGSSLQSEFPHGELVIVDDVRRHGGGMGYWHGIWSFSFIGSISLGFFVGAEVIGSLNRAWGFYICIIILAVALFVNVLTPETRRSPHRRTMQEVELPNESISRRVARGEIKMHVSGDGPKWWWEEVFAGVYLSLRMLLQSGFLLIAVYMGWIYAQIVLIIVLLGNLLSAGYAWRPQYVGLGVLSVAFGALLAVPNSKANFFSHSRSRPPRTDSMTFTPRFGWSSHMVRRGVFMTALPLAGLAYTLSSVGIQVHFMVPIIFAAMIGYISNLAIAECNGIIMETFDTSDLQPGTNSRHRLQSLSANVKRRRTTYTSYPRVSAGFFSAQCIGFCFAAAATGVGGAVTRNVGAQKATAITAGILLFLTLLLTCALIRFRVVQVIPNELFGQYFGSKEAERRKSAASIESDKSWRAVVIGNPSGKNRRMSWLELGSLSRWTEIRRLNRLLNRSTTQALNPGWQ